MVLTIPEFFEEIGNLFIWFGRGLLWTPELLFGYEAGEGDILLYGIVGLAFLLVLIFTFYEADQEVQIGARLQDTEKGVVHVTEFKSSSFRDIGLLLIAFFIWVFYEYDLIVGIILLVLIIIIIFLYQDFIKPLSSWTEKFVSKEYERERWKEVETGKKVKKGEIIAEPKGRLRKRVPKRRK
jgi:hypothetical protein